MSNGEETTTPGPVSLLDLLETKLCKRKKTLQLHDFWSRSKINAYGDGNVAAKSLALHSQKCPRTGHRDL